MCGMKNLFKISKPYIIGMIHIKALPGTPRNNSCIDLIAEKACEEAEIYKHCNVHSVLIENMHDVPYVQASSIGPEITASMTRVCSEIKRILPSHMTCGVQILSGANKEALAVAQAANLQYIRVEGFVYSHIADEGLMNSCAGDLLRYRTHIKAENICIFTDIKKKHCSHSITNDLTLEDTAKAAQYFLSDGIILTGKETGNPVNINDFEQVKLSSSLPIIIGSGVTAENVEKFIKADGLIVGSFFKKDGLWSNEIDPNRVLSFMKAVEEKKVQHKI